MGPVAVDLSETPHLEWENHQTVRAEENDIEKNSKPGDSHLQHPNEGYIPIGNSAHQESFTANEILDIGCFEYGCSHYRRRCRIRAPCCNEIFDCRHCHNEAKVMCSLCGTEQEVQQVCINCGVCMGRYYCGICKVFDDDTSKRQFHCNACGICRIGGQENFFHCDKCACCYTWSMKSSHSCVERAMHHNCPICFEYIFDSRDSIACLQCGHTLHKTCFEEMLAHDQYACPLCFMSVGDLSEVWEKFDEQIAATPMPAYYRDKMVWIRCNDCRTRSQANFHVLGLKCLNCNSYNTRLLDD